MGSGFRVHRNCIGFGSGVLGGFAGFWGVLGGFAGFWGVLGGFAFAFVFWAVGSGLWARGLCSGLGSGLERVMLQQQTHKAVLEKPSARPRSIIVQIGSAFFMRG